MAHGEHRELRFRISSRGNRTRVCRPGGRGSCRVLRCVHISFRWHWTCSIYDTYKITRGVEPLTDSRATRFRSRPPLYPRPGYLALASPPSRYPVLLLTFHLSPVTLILWLRDNLPYRLAAPALRSSNYARFPEFRLLHFWRTGQPYFRVYSSLFIAFTNIRSDIRAWTSRIFNSINTFWFLHKRGSTCGFY